MPNGKAIISKTDDKNLDTQSIGLYEGAGCVLKGVYRPTPNCMMKTLKVPILSRFLGGNTGTTFE